jgi:lipoyl(octanoyl) transferase
METWYLLNSGSGEPAYNMALDEALLESAPQMGHPVLRFYGWTEPAATFGYSQRYADVAAMTLLRPLIRRTTGGGLVPHDADWTYSLIFPPQHFWHRIKAAESYCRLHEWIARAFARLEISATLAPCSQKEIPGQCFVGAEKSDLLWHGRKIAGAAQRRARTGLLIQGSVQPPPLRLERAAWESAMGEEAEKGIEWAPLPPAQMPQELAARLQATRYAQPSFNQKR